MNALDQERIERARERLESATRDGAVSDPAIRIVKLNPPVTGAEPVHLNRKLTMLSGLSNSGKRTLFATIEGMQRDAAPFTNESTTHETSPETNDPHVAQLRSIISSCEQALMLTGAEMRGADLVLSDLDEKLALAAEHDASNHDQAASAHTPHPIDPRFETFIASVLAMPSELDSIEKGLAGLSTDPRRVALQAACTIDVPDLDNPQNSSTGPRLFGSTNRTQLQLVRAEAEGELSEYDMTPGSPAYVLASRLDFVGIPTSPLDAVAVATDLISQVEHARANAAAYEGTVQLLTGSAAALATERAATQDRRAHAARRWSTMQHVSRIAQSQLTRDGGRPRGLMPVLVEEPFADLPTELTHATLTMLLQHAEIAQVILLTNRTDVRRWCGAVDGRAECVDATGWFAEEHDEW